jgi:hypothetical protein
MQYLPTTTDDTRVFRLKGKSSIMAASHSSHIVPGNDAAYKKKQIQTCVKRLPRASVR